MISKTPPKADKKSKGFSRKRFVWVVASICVLLSEAILTPIVFSHNDFSKIKKEFIKGYKSTHSGDFKAAIAKFQKIRDSDIAIRDYILYYLALALHGSLRCEESKKVFEELVNKFPESRWYSLAKDQVGSPDQCPPLKASSLTELGSPCEGLIDPADRADCLFRNRDYQEAKKAYQELPSTTANLRRLSQAAARSQDFETAIAANETILKESSKGREVSAAFNSIVFLHFDAQRFDEAIPLLKDLIRKTPRRRDLGREYERLGWAYYRLKKYGNAIEAFEKAWSINRNAFSLYWKGRCLALLGQSSKAKSVFEGIVDQYPRSYYAVRSMARLRSVQDPVGEGAIRSWWSPQDGGLKWIERTHQMGNPLFLQKVDELMAVGLEEDARIELRRARWITREPLPTDPRFIKRQGDHFPFEVREPLSEDPDYRLPYADFIFTHFRPVSLKPLDPYFLYSLMRQESRFREGVVSPVGAIGILQMMPVTGRKVALENDWENFDAEWLYDPLTNIELSIRYLEKLNKLMDGKWYAIAASYNAGEDVVSEWLKQRSTLTDEEFIEEIPYSETRDYVKKIYTNWIAYRTIYQSK